MEKFYWCGLFPLGKHEHFSGFHFFFTDMAINYTSIGGRKRLQNHKKGKRLKVYLYFTSTSYIEIYTNKLCLICKRKEKA